ncbi:hypothetical protein LXD69_16100 [Flavobacterium sediminilitoris]|uniref:Trimeric autotransporter adhesin YadA-like head domain-containing protein n=1 Tax=Flavobacterium sediminilitoris TaxID=2024526 RepID=A0ABY4HMI7_9FLAO|nr:MULTISPECIES: hypothetical protein [Flavobacterium]UOX33542.1 hypothetical protein LXD69_16100 [Flavobacterium sediminilitoris]
MKKTLLLTIAFCFSRFLFSQVGIGTTSPDVSSALDIKSNNSGLLIPRVNLLSSTDKTTISNPAISLLVYNTSTISDVTPGFYYWDTVWKKMNNAAGAIGTTSGWAFNGNTLTTGSEYLGTNNYHSLAFKINNSSFGRFHPNGGISIGRGSTSNDEHSIAIGTSANSSASNEAIAIGRNSSASGYRSVALGFNSSSSNNNSIALGNFSTASGEQATAIGTGATSSGQNATAIGYQATASQANSIILGNSTSSNNKIGIGTNSPDERLHVNGSIKIVDGNQGLGKVLVSNESGKASWADLNDLKLYGEIYKNSSSVLSSGAINLGTNGVSNGMSLNASSIQVQKTGLYRISYTVSLRKSSGSAIHPEFYLGIYGTEIPGTRTYSTISGNDTRTVSLVKLVNLTAYEAVSIYSSLSNTNTNLLANGCSLVIELIK